MPYDSKALFLSQYFIVSPHFFKNGNGKAATVTVYRYTNMLHNLRPQFEKTENFQAFWFQQDGPTCHNARIRMAILREMFPVSLISCFSDIPWPACSPDLLVNDFFLWGCLKSRRLVDRHQNTAKFEVRIRQEIQNIRQ